MIIILTLITALISPVKPVEDLKFLMEYNVGNHSLFLSNEALWCPEKTLAIVETLDDRVVMFGCYLFTDNQNIGVIMADGKKYKVETKLFVPKYLERKWV